jgi:hypothetical protein
MPPAALSACSQVIAMEEESWRREWDSILALNPKQLITDFKRLAQST